MQSLLRRHGQTTGFGGGDKITKMAQLHTFPDYLGSKRQSKQHDQGKRPEQDHM
jgi:hypothetical protein